MRISLTARLTAALVSVMALSAVWVGPAAASSDTYAYVTNQGDGTITPVDVTTGVAHTAFSVGSSSSQPSAIALAPDGTSHAGSAYVTERGSNKVVVLDVATSPAAPTITHTVSLPTGSEPDALAITPDGTTAYVADYGTGKVTAINLSTFTQQQITVGPKPLQVAITPNGELAYVIHTAKSGGGTTVTPIVVVDHNIVGTSFGGVGASPQAIAINPNGTTGYVASASSGQLIPFSIPSEKTHSPINVPAGPWALTTTTDGSKAYVVSVVPPSGLSEVNLTTGQTVGTPLQITGNPVTLTLGPTGTAFANTAYVVQQGNGSTDGSITPVNLSGPSAGSAITVGVDPSGIVVSPWVPVTTGQGTYNLGNLGSAAKKTIKKSTHAPKLKGRRLKFGNQVVTLNPIVHGKVRRRGHRLCVAPRATVFMKLVSKRVRHGKKAKVAHVLMLLGHHRKASKRHAPARIALRHVKKGNYMVVAKLTFVRRIVKHVKRHHHRVKVHKKVHKHKQLKIRLHVC